MTSEEKAPLKKFIIALFMAIKRSDDNFYNKSIEMCPLVREQERVFSTSEVCLTYVKRCDSKEEHSSSFCIYLFYIMDKKTI